MLRVVVLNVIMQNIVILSVAFCFCYTFNIVMLTVVRESVIMLSVINLSDTLCCLFYFPCISEDKDHLWRYFSDGSYFG
jgi:hypothetical protein